MLVRGSVHRGAGLAVVLLSLLLAGGCGPGMHPVEGKVVWQDGSPATELAGGNVIFDQPEKRISARGFIETDGTFRLSTNRPNDGAVAGEHKVSIIENRKLLNPGGSVKDRAALADQSVGNPSARERQRVYAERVEPVDGAGRRGVVTHPARRERRGHEENQQRPHAVVAEALPHLGEEQRGQSTRVSEKCPFAWPNGSLWDVRGGVSGNGWHGTPLVETLKLEVRSPKYSDF